MYSSYYLHDWYLTSKFWKQSAGLDNLRQ